MKAKYTLASIDKKLNNYVVRQLPTAKREHPTTATTATHHWVKKTRFIASLQFVFKLVSP
ncbi:MAG: hypothetical protein RMX96_22345 [Nostoc sp. ChiSLP02]|nr:hypothetical protein [Nostoc sp. ChiSLP02]